MIRATVFVASVSVLCLTVSVDARAEPIRISGGFLDFNGERGSGPFQAGPLSIVGNRGFSADGFVDSGETRVALALSGGLAAASTISTLVEIESSGFVNGRVMLDGQTHDDVNNANATEYLDLTLSGTIDLPEWRNAFVTISAPLTPMGSSTLLPPRSLNSTFQYAAAAD